MSTAVVPGARARMPAPTEEPCPASGVGFTAKRTGNPSSARAVASCSGPTTTTTSWIPAPTTCSVACRSTVVPAYGRSSLDFPIRRDRPAASTMAVIMRGPKKEVPRTHARGASKCRDGSLLRGCRLHGPLGEDPEEMLLLLDRALEIRLDVDTPR